MKKIKTYISIAAIISVIIILIFKPQYMENAAKVIIAIMECEQCMSE